MKSANGFFEGKCHISWNFSSVGKKDVYETLQLEIISVIESLNQLRESPDYELCQLSGQKAGVLDELASERARLLDQESSELEKQAERLAAEIKELNGEAALGIS
jgi:hypothetical protein